MDSKEAEEKKKSSDVEEKENSQNSSGATAISIAEQDRKAKPNREHGSIQGSHGSDRHLQELQASKAKQIPDDTFEVRHSSPSPDWSTIQV